MDVLIAKVESWDPEPVFEDGEDRCRTVRRGIQEGLRNPDIMRAVRIVFDTVPVAATASKLVIHMLSPTSE